MMRRTTRHDAPPAKRGSIDAEVAKARQRRITLASTAGVKGDMLIKLFKAETEKVDLKVTKKTMFFDKQAISEVRPHTCAFAARALQPKC
jgi:hypothetical protein